MQDDDKALHVTHASYEAGTLSPEFLEKMYDRISKMGNIGVWECDLATEALTWSDAVYDLFEFPRRSLVTRESTLACYEPNSRREMEKRRARAVATCSTFTADVAIRTPRGNARWIRITGDVEQENGRAVRIFGTKQDITVGKTAQLELQALQSEILQFSRLTAIDAMRSSLAHELNQPLAAIVVYAAALRDELRSAGSDRASTSEILQGLEDCSLKVGTILRELRTMAGSRSKAATAFAIDAAIYEACRIAMPERPEDLTVNYTMQDGLHAVGDPVQIQQVVINLIQNACDAMEGLDKRELTIATAHRNGFAEVSIRDSGTGIAADVIGSLFDSFVTTRANRAGIGLAISRTIVEAHSGKLTAENNPDGGATFRFIIPTGPVP